MKYALFITVVFYLIIPSFNFSQSNKASISGTISLPEVKNKNRTLRGRMYRNRLSEPQKDSENDKTKKSPYSDVIVIFYPQSFTPKTVPMKGVQIRQKDAEFVPHVTPITRNTTVEFVNFDHFYHNVFSLTPGAKFNIGRRPANSIVQHKITRSGEIKLFCDIHAQMNAIILSLDTPYFTRVKDDGTYNMTALPNGEYMIEVYHPELNSIEEFVTINNNESVSRNFSFSR